MTPSNHLSFYLMLSIFIGLVSITGCKQTNPASETEASNPLATNKNFSFNAMAPLEMNSTQEWLRFEKHLKQAKFMGLDGVSVDVWWGKVEAAGDQQFDWSYYRKIANLLAKYNLQWIPIMSFHQCGGNVGDTCDIPLPTWIWQHFEGVSENALKFKSEQGFYSNETLSVWQSETVLTEIHRQYQQFMKAFEQEFKSHKDNIQELNVSMGPAGELRYPSYNAHDEGSGFPTRGAIQGFSAAAEISFKRFLNTASTKAFISTEFNMADLNFDDIFTQGTHLESSISQAYLNWYHQSLVRHGQRMLVSAHTGFGCHFKDIPLGFKIPGIHWKISATEGLHRSAEMAAGLIAPTPYNESNAWGYRPILDLASSFQSTYQRKVIVHFTALEMSNTPQPPQFSQAKQLVHWLAKGAEQLGVTIKGENALAGGVYQARGWDNIDEAMTHHYSGLTVLRLGDIADSGRNAMGYQRYSKIIETYSPQ